MADTEGTPEATGVTTEELLQQLLDQQRAHTKELAQLRAERKVAPPQSSAAPRNPEELLAERMDTLKSHEYYCPACGIVGDYPQKCVGRGEAPHHPTEMVQTSEVTEGDTDQHTAAPWVTGEGNLVVP